MASWGRFLIGNKVGCVYPMVILFEFRMEQNRDNGEDASHFIPKNKRLVPISETVLSQFIFLSLEAWILHPQED